MLDVLWEVEDMLVTPLTKIRVTHAQLAAEQRIEGHQNAPSHNPQAQRPCMLRREDGELKMQAVGFVKCTESIYEGVLYW